MKKVTVLLADDNPDMLCMIQEMLAPTFDIIAAVGDGKRLVSAAIEYRPDVIITDISMPVMDGIDATVEIIKREPDSKIILLTVNRDRMLVDKGLSCGALGYVLKLSAGEELTAAIFEVLEGRPFVSSVLRPDDTKNEYSELSLNVDHTADPARIGRPNLPFLPSPQK